MNTIQIKGSGLGFMYYDFVTPKTTLATLILEFHHNIFVILFFILGLLTYLIYATIYVYSAKQNKLINRSFFGFNFFKHKGLLLEIIWTLFPAVVLFIIAIPSFGLLYSTVNFIDPELSVKIIGHQWYWRYNWLYTNPFKDPMMEAYLLKTKGSRPNIPRATMTDTVFNLPTSTNIRLIVTSYDVLHSWAIPSLGVKIDACPGRLNEVLVNVHVPGLVVGACSEICGINHAFMPISLLFFEACDWSF